MKKKILTSIIVSVVFLAVLFVPIPGGQMKDGGTKVYSSLTYKIVEWNRLYNDEKYSETKIYFGADAWKSIDDLFAMEEPNIKSVVRATVIEIGGNYVLIEPLEGEFECLSSDRISINISDLEDIGVEVGSLVEVTYKGGIMESYPAQINVVSWKKSSMNVLPGGSDVHKGCEHNWERIDNFNEYFTLNNLSEMSLCQPVVNFVTF